jgi:hypothetical protein
MHAAVCLLHAGQPKHAVDEAKSGEFLGEFSWVVYDPMVVRGLTEFWNRLFAILVLVLIRAIPCKTTHNFV